MKRVKHSILSEFYDGMTPGVLEMTLPSSNKYDWAASLDGRNFPQSAGGVAGTGGSNNPQESRSIYC